MTKPLAIDLFCGLGGWAEGFLAEGYDVIGFDVERHDYGTGGYPGQLVLQDVATLDGCQFRNAAVIVASPPCQEYSYMAMPWSRGKAKAAAIREDINLWLQLTCLFNACFRIAHQAGVPLIVENVRGAEPWVGPARWHFRSFYLWGDVPALMPPVRIPAKRPGMNWSDRNNPDRMFNHSRKVSGFRFDGSGKSFQTASVEGTKNGNGARDEAYRLTEPRPGFGVKFGGGWWNDSTNNLIRRASSGSSARKAASAQIAKIPFPLAQHIARVFRP